MGGAYLVTQPFGFDPDRPSMQRKRLKPRPAGGRVELKPTTGGRYFDNPNGVKCFSTGCELLNCVISGARKKGGWALGRISNVVGDKSTGKTLQAIEATANFAIEFPDRKKNKIRYREVEAAFDTGYAQSLGMDLDRVEIPDDPIDTVEEFFKDLDDFIKSVPVDGAGLYILDSLDALSDRDEVEAEFGKDSYGAKKPKLLGQLFRRLVRKIEHRNIHVMIISQLRDKIGVSFGEKQSRSGGRALDFYASQVIWLANLGRIYVTRKKVKRAIGVNVRAMCKKNKVAMPFRDCDYPIVFAYGVDDLAAAVAWLQSVGKLNAIGLAKAGVPKYLSRIKRLNPVEIKAERIKINQAVRTAWVEVERRFMPTQSKY